MYAKYECFLNNFCHIEHLICYVFFDLALVLLNLSYAALGSAAICADELTRLSRSTAYGFWLMCVFSSLRSPRPLERFHSVMQGDWITLLRLVSFCSGVELLSEFFVLRRFVVIALGGLVVVVFASCVLAYSCSLLVIIFHFPLFIAQAFVSWRLQLFLTTEFRL